MSTKTNDHEFGTRFDCPNMEEAILLANSHADVSGKMRGVGLQTNCGAILTPVNLVSFATSH